jgi:hypothetical protein
VSDVETVRNPLDPRNNPNYKPHKARRFTYTWDEIATILGCSKGRAQNMASEGLFFPKSIVSIFNFAKDRAARAAEKASRIEPEVLPSPDLHKRAPVAPTKRADRT